MKDLPMLNEPMDIEKEDGDIVINDTEIKFDMSLDKETDHEDDDF